MLQELADFGLVDLLPIWAVVVFASVMRAFTGFGFALCAVPVFSLFLPPVQAVVLSASLTLSISLLRLRTYWGVVPLRPIMPLVATALLGTAAGAALLTTISAAQFQLWVGLAVILACLGLTFFHPGNRRQSPFLAGITGLISGLMNGAFAIPGPPVVIYAMATEPQPLRSRALLMTFFLFSAVLALCSYGVAGFISMQSVWHFLLAFPAMYAGDRFGYYLFHRFGDALYRRIALAGLLAVGVTITLRALL